MIEITLPYGPSFKKDKMILVTPKESVPYLAVIAELEDSLREIKLAMYDYAVSTMDNIIDFLDDRAFSPQLAVVELLEILEFFDSTELKEIKVHYKHSAHFIRWEV
jgi:hypothetical protein